MEMKVSLMTLLPCDSSRVPGAQDLVNLQRSSAMYQERAAKGKPSDLLWKLKRHIGADRVWRPLELNDYHLYPRVS